MMALNKTVYRCIDCSAKFYKATDFIRHHNDRHLVPEDIKEQEELTNILSEGK